MLIHFYNGSNKLLRQLVIMVSLFFILIEKLILSSSDPWLECEPQFLDVKEKRIKN